MTAAERAADRHLIDGGDLGCGELLLKVAREVRQLPPGSLVELRTLDAGAPVEVPTWCRLTGHHYLGIISEVRGDRTFSFRTRATDNRPPPKGAPS